MPVLRIDIVVNGCENSFWTALVSIRKGTPIAHCRDAEVSKFRGFSKQRYSNFTQRIEALGIAFSRIVLAKTHNLALIKQGKKLAVDWLSGKMTTFARGVTCFYVHLQM